MISRLLLALIYSLSGVLFADPIRFELLQGAEIAKYTDDFIKICHQIYREYPYLYSGDDAGYDEYVRSYAGIDNSIACFALDGDKVIGICSGMPLQESRPSYQKAFVSLGIDVTPIFYLGEIILLKEYRNQKIGSQLYSQVEQVVINDGRYEKIALCKVEVSQEDFKRPDDYKFSEFPLCYKLGFSKHPEICYDGYWTNVGESIESPHHMVFWIKDIHN